MEKLKTDLCEFKASLVYIVRSRTAGATGSPCLKKTKGKKKMLLKNLDFFICEVSVQLFTPFFE